MSGQSASEPIQSLKLLNSAPFSCLSGQSKDDEVAGCMRVTCFASRCMKFSDDITRCVVPPRSTAACRLKPSMSAHNVCLKSVYLGVARFSVSAFRPARGPNAMR